MEVIADALQVRGGEHRMPALAQQVFGELAARRRLARPLKPAHHDHGGRRLHEINPRVHRSHEIDQLIVNNLHHKLARLKAADHLLAERLLLNVFCEFLDDIEIDIRLEQRRANIANGLAYVFLAEAAAARKVPKYAA